MSDKVRIIVSIDTDYQHRDQYLAALGEFAVNGVCAHDAVFISSDPLIEDTGKGGGDEDDAPKDPDPEPSSGTSAKVPVDSLSHVQLARLFNMLNPPNYNGRFTVNGF